MTVYIQETVLMLNWIVRNITVFTFVFLLDRNKWNDLTVCKKKWAQVHLKMLSIKCV